MLALSYALFHSIVSLLDKILLKNKKVDPLGLSAYRFLANVVISGILLFILGKSIAISGATFWIYVFPLCVIYTISALAYFFAMKTGDVSKIVPLGHSMTILLAFLFSIFFLKETTGLGDLFGTLLIVVGAYTILTNGKIQIPKMSKELMLIFVWAATLSLWGIMSKPATKFITPPVLNFFLYTLTALNFFVINPIINFKRFSNLGKTILTNGKIMGLTLLSSFFATIGTFLLFLALTVGNASEILPVSRTIPLFAILWGWLILKERHYKIRFLGSLLIVLGIFLIYY